jgi:haloacetate dehalogenase
VEHLERLNEMFVRTWWHWWLLLLPATQNDLDIHGDPEAIWRPWVAGKLRSAPIRSGHHQAEQAPDELAQALRAFLAAPTP